jgi:spore germination protein
MIAARRLFGLSAPALIVALVACAVPTSAPDTDASAQGLRAAAYLVPWDPRSQPGAGAAVLAEVSPVWYQPTESGGVAFASEQAKRSETTVEIGEAALTPSISNFRQSRWDGQLVARLVADPTRRSAHVAAIVDLVRSKRWPGIDIDYESLPASSRAAYSAFIAELAAALHRVPARLSVTLHAKTAEPGGWPGARAQDWRAIGAAADEVRVMAYDFSSAGSPPGPIAPPEWVEKVLVLATSLMPRKRIMLGLPTYGYDWTAKAKGRAVQWADVQAIAQTHAATPRWDETSSAPSLRYTDSQGRPHTVWYEDARSLAAKLDLAKRHGVTRVVLWRLGGEDPDVWPALRAPR